MLQSISKEKILKYLLQKRQNEREFSLHMRDKEERTLFADGMSGQKRECINVESFQPK